MTANTIEKMKTCAYVEKYAREDYQIELEERLNTETLFYDTMPDEEYNLDPARYEDQLTRAYAKVLFNQARLEWLKKLIDTLEHEPQFEDFYEREG